MNEADQLAGRFRRLIAAVIDYLLIAGVAFLAMWPLGVFEDQQAYERGQFILRLLALLVGTYLVLNGWLLVKRGQTLGKWMLGIRIAGHPCGQVLPLWKHLFRAFVILVLVAVPALGIRPVQAVGLVLILAVIDAIFIFGKQRRCLHDRLVGSTVLRVRA